MENQKTLDDKLRERLQSDLLRDEQESRERAPEAFHKLSSLLASFGIE